MHLPAPSSLNPTEEKSWAGSRHHKDDASPRGAAPSTAPRPHMPQLCHHQQCVDSLCRDIKASQAAANASTPHVWEGTSPTARREGEDSCLSPPQGLRPSIDRAVRRGTRAPEPTQHPGKWAVALAMQHHQQQRGSRTLPQARWRALM